MWPLFKKRTKLDAAIARQLKAGPLADLLKVIITTSFLANKLIREICPTLAKTNPTWHRRDWQVRMEVLAFILHFTNRQAFSVRGAGRRAKLQDIITPAAVRTLIEVSFNDSKADKGFDNEAWRDQMYSDCLGIVNDAEMDYSGCESIVFSEKGKQRVVHMPDGSTKTIEGTGASSFINEKGVVGKMTSRIVLAVGESDDNLGVRLALMGVATQVLKQAKLLERVKRACDSIS